jgi:predicted AAA+ superfamily ATPase
MYAIVVLMKERRRLYTETLTDHLQKHRQMALVSGPRQVGKTTACRSICDMYLQLGQYR